MNERGHQRKLEGSNQSPKDPRNRGEIESIVDRYVDDGSLGFSVIVSPLKADLVVTLGHPQIRLRHLSHPDSRKTSSLMSVDLELLHLLKGFRLLPNLSNLGQAYLSSSD